MSFKSAPNYEENVNNNNYRVEVIANDGTDNEVQIVIVTVTDANDPAQIDGDMTGSVTEDVASMLLVIYRQGPAYHHRSGHWRSIFHHNNPDANELWHVQHPCRR